MNSSASQVWQRLTSGFLAVWRLIAVHLFSEAKSKDEVAAWYRAAHTGLAIFFALVFCYVGGLGIFQPILNKIFSETSAITRDNYFSLLDPAITAMVLAAGSERLSALRKKFDDSPQAGETPSPDPDTKEGDVTARATFADAAPKTLEVTVSRDAEGVAEGQKSVGTREEE